MLSQSRATSWLLSSPVGNGVALVALVLLALIMRIPSLMLGLWRDECLTVFVVQAASLKEMIQLMQPVDYNPPLYYLLMLPFIKAFGVGEIAIRIPSLIFGLALVPACYFLGCALKSRGAGLLMALFCVLSPQAVFFSTQARTYSLAALFCALTSAFLCMAIKKDLVDNAGSRASVPWLAFMGLSLTAFLYSNYMGVVWLLGVGLAMLYLRYRHKSFPFLRYLIALGLPAASFLAWVPVVLNQIKWTAPWEEKTPLFMFPVVFFSNVYCIIPLPFLWSFLGLLVGVLCFTVWLIRQAAQRKANTALKEMWTSLSPMEITLIICLIVPCSVLGYITSYYFGLFRYMYPFLPIGWALLSTWTLWFFSKIEMRIPEKMWKRAPLTVAIAVLLLSNMQQALCLGQIPRSGLRTLASEVTKGRYPRTIFLVAPDFDGITFAYYLGPAAKNLKDVALHGFARWDPQTPWNSPGYGAMWRDPQLVETARGRLSKLVDTGQYHYLAFVRDPYNPNTPLMPSRDRIDDLLAKLMDQYRLVSRTKYEGVTELVEVYLFDLSSGGKTLSSSSSSQKD